jgi:iduronate 2-sulfatase
VDQSAVVNDPGETVRDHVIHVYPRGGRLGLAIRTPRYRLVQWKTFGAPESEAIYELYDYQTDPLESANHYEQLPEVAKQLKAILATYPDPRPQVRSQPASKPPANKQSSDRSSLRNGWFAKRDKDQNGQLTMEEFLSNQPDSAEAKKRFPRFDTNSDGQVSQAEYVGAGRE